jgi:peptidoglycan hydrolase CwlO-like protein
MSNDTRTHQVSLGCGTLILIALIVMFFSNRSNNDVSSEITALKSEITGLKSQLSEIKTAIEAQTNEIKSLQQKLDKK